MGIESRVFNKELLSKITTAEEAAKHIKDGMIIGTSGFTPCGYPKAVPLAVAERIKKGEKMRFSLLTGASVGVELDEAWAEVNAIAKRFPYQTGKTINKRINAGDTMFFDIHLSQMAQQLRYGFLGKMDVAIVEAVCILENGGIVPSTSVGNSPTFLQQAEKVIVEVNTSQPMELVGMSDIFIPADPPARHPLPITDVNQRIGTIYMPCDPRKIVAIVPCDIGDKTRPLAPIDEQSKAMARHLIKFLEKQRRRGAPAAAVRRGQRGQRRHGGTRRERLQEPEGLVGGHPGRHVRPHRRRQAQCRLRHIPFALARRACSASTRTS